MGVKITNSRSNYSMSQARVTIPQPCNSFGITCVYWRTDMRRMVSCWCTKPTNEEDGEFIRRKQAIGAKRGASIDISQDLIGNTFTPEKYKEVQVEHGGGWQYVRQRRFDACIVMPWPLDQGTQMLIVARIVAASCHHHEMSHKHGFNGRLGTITLV